MRRLVREKHEPLAVAEAINQVSSMYVLRPALRSDSLIDVRAIGTVNVIDD